MPRVSKIFRWIPSIKEPYALYLVIRDSRTPWPARLWAFSIISLMIAYIVSPIDIALQFNPILGAINDLLLFPVGILLIEKMLPKEILVENRNKANRKINRIFLMIIIGILAILVLGSVMITGIVVLVLKLIHG